jgi:hypothetical protein
VEKIGHKSTCTVITKNKKTGTDIIGPVFLKKLTIKWQAL